MINSGARKGHGALMARLARGIRRDMFGRFSDRYCAAVAFDTIGDESGVVQAGAGERCGALMARLAGGVSGDVVWPLAGRCDAVVAGRATADEARMVRLRVEHA